MTGQHEERAQKSYKRWEPEPSVPDEQTSYSGGSGGGGGGGGGAVGVGLPLGGAAIGKLGVVIFFLIIAIPLGLILQWQKQRTAISDLKSVKLTVSTNSNPSLDTGIVPYDHGQPQTLFLYVNWDREMTLYESERPLRLIVERERKVIYDYSWPHNKLGFNDFAVKIPGTFPAGRYVARAIVEGAPPAEYRFVVRGTPPGDIWVSDTLFNNWPSGRITALRHQPGQNQKLYIGASLTETIPPEGRAVSISLLHDGVPLFDWPYQLNEQNRQFYVPYEYDFPEGSYTARLSAKDAPPAEFAFTVQYPIIETPEEKSRRVQQFLDAVLPGGSHQDSTECYGGTWQDNQPNGSAWIFKHQGDILEIERLDGFGNGHFSRDGKLWLGSITFRNGERRDGLVLYAPNPECTRILSNQRFNFSR
ncbi:MAG: hypothetical protein ACHP78_00495 [Terriglobales bacterium]